MPFDDDREREDEAELRDEPPLKLFAEPLLRPELVLPELDRLDEPPDEDLAERDEPPLDDLPPLAVLPVLPDRDAEDLVDLLDDEPPADLPDDDPPADLPDEDPLDEPPMDLLDEPPPDLEESDLLPELFDDPPDDFDAVDLLLVPLDDPLDADLLPADLLAPDDLLLVDLLPVDDLPDPVDLLVPDDFPEFDEADLAPAAFVLPAAPDFVERAAFGAAVVDDLPDLDALDPFAEPELLDEEPVLFDEEPALFDDEPELFDDEPPDFDELLLPVFDFPFVVAMYSPFVIKGHLLRPGFYRLNISAYATSNCPL